MIHSALVLTAKTLLGLRYRVEVRGLAELRAGGDGPMLLLPNHPALIDPVVLATWLGTSLRPVFLADDQQIDRPVLRTLAHYYGVEPLPDVKELGGAAREAVERALAACADHLRAGRNVALYPSGHLYRSRLEDLRGNSAVEKLKQAVPNVRLVAVRIRGLWGSAFSWADGREPDVGRALRAGASGLASSGVFFAPRRRITIELRELEELRGATTRDELNGALERFYNDDAPGRLHVPYSVWERGGPRALPEPLFDVGTPSTAAVPEATRRAVLEHLGSLTGVKELADDADLSRDLGLDSLARAELIAWIAKEFGIEVSAATSLDTVADVLLAAAGEAVSRLPRRLAPVPLAWARGAQPARIAPSARAETLWGAFLDVVDRGFRRPLVADQTSGMRSAGELLTGAVALGRRFADLEGDYVGVLLPASVAATVTYLGLLFAGKTPVMINWTVGARSVGHALDKLEIRAVVTSEALLARLNERGFDMSPLEARLIKLETVGRSLTRGEKLRALWAARFGRGALRKAKVRDEAVVLFTSGSEALPKAVPLTHRNLLTNLRDALEVLPLDGRDVLLGMLPPFHSFGLTVGVGVAVAAGLRVAYSPDPTDAGLLARLIEAYGATMLVGTPTFVSGIVRAGTKEQLRSVRLVVTGAEACPERVADAVRERCPTAVMVEGYGITECSPVVSVNRPEAPHAGTIGIPLPSVRTAIVTLDRAARVPRGEQGLLLVGGPSVFGGYLRHDGASPFVSFEGAEYYDTGNLVTEGALGLLTFRGRLKRFVKIGGEMVSLPAVEQVLAPLFPEDERSPGPAHAVLARPGERPELVLVTTRAAEQAAVNEHVRQSGLSALHSIRHVLRVDAIPVLGTGKTDYRSLQARIDADAPTDASVNP